MDRKNYFNFLAFRKGLYDIELSERARLIYIHLLQKSSAKGSNEIELTKAQIASDLGILTKRRDGLALKNVQRSLEELEEHGYLRRWQKYKGENVPLTIKLNFDEGFLRQKRNENATSSDKNEPSESEKPSENVHPYNPSLSSSNPNLSSSNPNLSDLSENGDMKENDEEVKNLEKELCEEAVQEPKEDWRSYLYQLQNNIEIATTVEEVDSAYHRFVVAIKEIGGIPRDCKPEVDKVMDFKNLKVWKLKTKASPI